MERWMLGGSNSLFSLEEFFKEEIVRCHVEQEIEQVNPLDIKLNTKYRTHLTEPVKRHNVKRARSKVGLMKPYFL